MSESLFLKLFRTNKLLTYRLTVEVDDRLITIKKYKFSYKSINFEQTSMKKYCMKKQGFNLIAIILFATFSIHLGLAQGSQGFQGVIEFTKSTAIDTTDYAYYVKGDMIRIEEIGSDKKVAGIFLVNIRTNKAKALSPERKLYMDQSSGNAQASSIKNIEVIKGKNTKTIAGYKCREVIVKNKDQDTQITYYLGKDDFHFFDGMLIALNRKDKLSTYYQ